MPRPSLTSHLSLKRLLSNTSQKGVAVDGTTTPTNEKSTNGNTSPTKMKDAAEAKLTLHVHALKGRNLAPKDSSGTSDPYLVINLGEARTASSVVPKTLHPEWNQTLDLPITGVESLLLEVVCWDKDRFKKDYMGEFDLALEDIFKHNSTTPEPQWYALKAKKSKKKAIISGEVQLKFSISDPTNPAAQPEHILEKFYQVMALEPAHEDDDLDDLDRMGSHEGADDDDDQEPEQEQNAPSDDSGKKKKKRLARLKKKTKLRAYEFTGQSDVAGVLFLEVSKITDLPPEKNMTRTSFDMDPFVITSLGRKTYRTRVIRHNLNPVFDEKLVFSVLRHEVNYSLNFTIVDWDKLSGNDFIGNVDLPLDKIKAAQPEADATTGLYKIEMPDGAMTPTPEGRRSKFRLPLSRSTSSSTLDKSRSASSSNLPKLARTESATGNGGQKKPSLTSMESTDSADTLEPLPEPGTSAPTSNPALPLRAGSNGSYNGNGAPLIQVESRSGEDPDFKTYTLPIKLKKADRWEAKHSPTLYLRAKYLPYQALRQQFWRAMLRSYDADENGNISKIELTTMLDSLGSTLRDATIDSFYERFAKDNGGSETLTVDQAVMCLEDQLQRSQTRSLRDTIRRGLPSGLSTSSTPMNGGTPGSFTPGSRLDSDAGTPLNNQSQTDLIPTLETHPDLAKTGGHDGSTLAHNDLVDEDRSEEHVVEIQECPICHQPRLDKKNSEADIITHIATCASQDWRAVNNIVMGGFVTTSQAQRKWYSKVITKIGYGGYKIGANSANTLVQDRMTGQINEERMSVYVRLGIRLLYKGLKSRDMEKKRIRKLLKSMSYKQGRKYDDPASASQIPSFINFHQLDMSEVLLTTSQFKTFNEFFYRQLKPDARPCSAPDRPEIITSPADCRSVVFNQLETAQKIWVKGREFSVERLLGKAYPDDAKRYQGGALGIMRLAPQDYHRFHIPVDGVMGEPKLIEGEYYTVNPMAIRSALDVYGENIRVVVPIDSVCHGRVMVICVGAMMVGSTVITRKTGEHVKRAEELGYFKFGGSTILLLFEPGVMEFDQDLVDNASNALETLIRVGMSIGHSPDHAPYLPDMRKENPTMEEKQEAKRRIEGSFAPSTRAMSPIQAGDNDL